MSEGNSPPEELSAQKDGKQDKIVVVKAEAEELPLGWTKEVKIRKAGSKTKKDWYYTDPVTGCTFRSLKDAQRYLKTGDVGRLAIKPKNNCCVDMDVEEDKLHAGSDEHKLRDRVTDDQMSGQQSSSLVEMKNDEKLVESTSIEDDPHVSENASEPSGKKIIDDGDVDLPDAIQLEGGEEKSKLKEEMIVPSPLSETHKRPLEDGSEGHTKRSKSSEKSKSELPQRASKRLAGINVDAAPLSPSPPELKTRQATRLAGIKIDASLPEPKTRQATRLAGIKIDVPPPSPPKPKTHQATRLAGIKVDSPPSQPEPKTRQATRLAGIKIDSSTSPPMLPEPKTRQALRLAGMKIDAPSLSPPEPKSRQATRLTGLKIDAPAPHPSLPEPKTRQAAQPAGTKVGVPPASQPEPKTRQATRLAGIKIEAPTPSPPEPKSRQANARGAREVEASNMVSLAAPKESNMKSEAEESASCGMQVDPVVSSEVRLSTRVECVREFTEKHDGNADTVDKPNLEQEMSILLPPARQECCEKVNKDDFKADEKQDAHIVLPPVIPSTPREHYKEIETEPIALPPVSHTTHKEQAMPTVVCPANLEIETNNKHHEKQEPPVVTRPVGNPIPPDSYGSGEPPLPKPESPVNFSLNDLWTDPCIEFAVKTLTGAIPFGDLNKVDNFPASPLEVPLAELWTDPCIEFAVKTLTGDIPVGEDLCVQDYLQNQVNQPTSCSETRGQHSFSLPNVCVNNFCQTEVVSKHFEMPHNKQQDSVVSTFRSGGLQKSGNGVLPQQVKGSNGQSSRTFFQ